MSFFFPRIRSKWKKKCLKTNIELIAFELSFGTSYFAALSVKLTITAGIFFFFFFFFEKPLPMAYFRGIFLGSNKLKGVFIFSRKLNKISTMSYLHFNLHFWICRVALTGFLWSTTACSLFMSSTIFKMVLRQHLYLSPLICSLRPCL